MNEKFGWKNYQKPEKSLKGYTLDDLQQNDKIQKTLLNWQLKKAINNVMPGKFYAQLFISSMLILVGLNGDSY